MENNALTIGLVIIFLAVLAGPFLNKTVEDNLEVFLFVMGLLSATISAVWSFDLFREGLEAPIPISLV